MSQNGDWRKQRAEMRRSGALPEGERVPDAPQRIRVRDRGFRYWFQNHFWFHYRLPAIAGVVGAVLLGFFLYDAATSVRPDFSYAVAGDGYTEAELLEGFTALCAEAAGDLNGDGQTEILPQVLIMDDSEYGMANRQKFAVLMVDDEVLLYILDEPAAAQMREQAEAFVDLSAYSLPAEPDAPFLLRVDGYPAFQDALAPGPHYALVRRVSDGQQDVSARRDAAVASLRLLAQTP
jgi:hypothetical protein